MKIADLTLHTIRPEPHTPGNAVMWTDDYISQQLLQVHLNPDIDLASRTPDSINATLTWLNSVAGPGPHRILDLGCGPGLYTERLAREGHRVTGLDFAQGSIEYARKSAQKQSLEIEYRQGDYLTTDFGTGKYDIVMMIYTDFCALKPSDRDVLLAKVRRALAPGGKFVFDVLNGKDPVCRRESLAWDAQPGGFWRPYPYLTLSNTWFYTEENTLLNQHVIICDDEPPAVYRFWSRFYSDEELRSVLEAQGYGQVECHNNVLPGEGPWTGANVTFCVANVR